MTQYDALVQAGREARERADEMQWVEGDLALEVEALPADEMPRDPETGQFLDPERGLKVYADDVGIPRKTLAEYRRTAGAFPVATRVATAPWAVHRMLAGQEDRFELIRVQMTYREAQKLVQARTAGNQGKPGWLELIGQVGDDLIKAEKDLDKFDTALGEKEPTENVQGKAGRYAAMAESLAVRLRALEAA